MAGDTELPGACAAGTGRRLASWPAGNAPRWSTSRPRMCQISPWQSKRAGHLAGRAGRRRCPGRAGGQELAVSPADRPGPPPEQKKTARRRVTSRRDPAGSTRPVAGPNRRRPGRKMPGSGCAPARAAAWSPSTWRTPCRPVTGPGLRHTWPAARPAPSTRARSGSPSARPARPARTRRHPKRTASLPPSTGAGDPASTSELGPSSGLARSCRAPPRQVCGQALEGAGISVLELGITGSAEELAGVAGEDNRCRHGRGQDQAQRGRVDAGGQFALLLARCQRCRPARRRPGWRPMRQASRRIGRGSVGASVMISPGLT